MSSVSSLIAKFNNTGSAKKEDEMSAEILKKIQEQQALLSTILEKVNSNADQIKGLELKVDNLQSGSNAALSSSGGASSESTTELPRSIGAFDSYCTSFLNPFVTSCSKLGGDAEAVGLLVKDAWAEMRSFLLMASASKAPNDADLPGLFSKMAPKIKAIQMSVQRNTWENHTKTCSEGASALNWLMVKPAPRDFIQSGLEGAEYWANRIRKEFRGINPDQISFCDTYKTLLNELMAYVKEFHTTGVTWNPKGGNASDFSSGNATIPSSIPIAAPAVAASKPAVNASASAPPKVDLFAALNKGGDITSGLKTVTKDMQTWRAEYKGGDAPAPVKQPSVPKPAAAAAGPKGPPKLEFQSLGSKWVVENHGEGVQKVEIQGMKETVYIYGCIGATIDIAGKCKSIVVDGCKKTRVYFDNVMASCEVVNCQRVHIECRDKCSAVAIDKTDGIVVKLSKESMSTEVVCSKSSEMNIQWLDEFGELVERPIPEQYVHRIKNGAITADVSDLYGH